MSKIEKEIQKIIDIRHDNAVRIADENLRIALQSENIKRLRKEIKSIKIDQSKLEFLRDRILKVANSVKENEEITNFNNRITKMGSEILSLQKQVIDSLKSNHIEIKSLSPNYTCKKCNDTGLIGNKRCTCFNRLLNKYLLDLSGLNKNLPSFDKIDYSIYNDKTRDNVKIIVKTMQDIVKKYPNISKNMLCIFGKVGVGKTYLSECFVDFAIKNNIYTVYTTAYSLNQDMLSYHLAPINQKGDILDKYINCDILCLDDLGTENILKNVTIEYLYLILNERSQKGKFTLISTNLTPQQVMDTYDERIFSRLINKDKNITINLEGDDLRLRK